MQGIFSEIQRTSFVLYMKLKRLAYLRKRLIELGISIVNKSNILTRIGRKIPKGFKQKVLNPSLANVIDFEKSVAVCLGHTIPFGAVYVNVKSPGKRNEILERLIKDLQKLPEEIGFQGDVKCFRKEDIYHGEKTSLLPDIVFTINDYAFTISENLSDPLYRDGPYSPRHTGSHRTEGIILISGPTVKSRSNFKASIYDVMPTILYIHGLPIPNDVDGRPLRKLVGDLGEPKYVPRSYYEIKMKLKSISSKIGRIY